MTVGDRSGGACELVRRRDQALIAVALALSLAGLLGYQLYRGLHGPALIDMDRAPRLRAHYGLDVNRADWPEWTLLPGIGETLARRIVESRQRDGLFRCQEDLLRVRGIGPRTLERMRPYLLPAD